MPDDTQPLRTRWIPWALRAAWVVVGVAGAGAVTGAVEDRSDAVQIIATVGAATLWVVGVAAMALPAVVSLTATRAVVPLAPVVGAVALAGGGPGLAGAVLVGIGLVATLLAGSAELGQTFVQASAYGDEDRHLLRPPLGYLVASLVAWALWAAALLAGPLLLGARSWAAGALLTAVAVVATILLPGRWHRLARRWIVLVPAGLVLHDHVVLAETLMLRRTEIARLRLAPADTDALDLTGPTSGHAVEVTTNAPVTALLAPTRAAPRGTAIHLTAYLAAPSRPGQVLAGAARRRLPVG